MDAGWPGRFVQEANKTTRDRQRVRESERKKSDRRRLMEKNANVITVIQLSGFLHLLIDTHLGDKFILIGCNLDTKNSLTTTASFVSILFVCRCHRIEIKQV